MGLEEPVREGYTFDGWSIDGGGSMLRGIASGGKFIYKYMVNAKTVFGENENYTNYRIDQVNSNEKDNIYPCIQWPIYNYIPNHKYKISVWINTNELSGFSNIQIRHAAIGNDWGTEGWVKDELVESEKFIEYNLTRTFYGTEINFPRTTNLVPIIPRFEIYFYLPAGSTGIADIDIKNISIYDVTAGKYVTDGAYGGYIYKYGSGNATLTAKWIKNN